MDEACETDTLGGWCSALLDESTLAILSATWTIVRATSADLHLILVTPDGTSSDRVIDSDVRSGSDRSAIAGDGVLHLAYQKIDGGLYDQLVRP